MADEIISILPLTGGAKELVENGHRHARENGAEEPGIRHWLIALLERNGAMAATLVDAFDLASELGGAQKQAKAGDAGDPLPEASLLEQASTVARQRGKTQVAERDLAVVILRAAGYEVKATEEAWTPPAKAPEFHSAPSAVATATSSKAATESGGKTPALDMFGRDLTRAARDGKLSPVLHRDAVIQMVVETLCRRTKRNPVLVGAAGVGKTAIVEGVAQRIAGGNVPALLRDVRLIAVQPSTLVAGSGVVGELENRMKAIIAEASQPGIILFIDEIHTMMGAGGTRGATDMASLLKPVLARGDIACIGATTDDEYRLFIEEDKALERRFNRVNVDELSPSQTLGVLQELSKLYAQEQHVEVEPDVLPQLVRFAERHMKNRHFPDKAVDLLEQCVAHAVASGAPGVDSRIAIEISERVIGMPVDVEAAIPSLIDQLVSCQVAQTDAEALADRLQVTVRGLDLGSPRPNAVVLLTGTAASRTEDFAASIAGCLFGSSTRVVVIDFARFVNDHDISAFLGTTPGYVGYQDALPIHQIAQTPWCVLICENVDLCHPSLRSVLRQALASGYLTDGRGKRIYLSDTVVLLTCSADEASKHPKGPLGFTLAQLDSGSTATSVTPSTGDEALVRSLGEGLLAQVDLVISELGSSKSGLLKSLEGLLANISERYAQHNVDVSWHATAVNFILDRGQANWERFVDRSISPLLVRFVPDGEGKEKVRVSVSAEGDRINVERSN